MSRELEGARDLVARHLTRLGYEPSWQNVFGTEEGDIRKVLREKVSLCAGVIQLVGYNYGFEPPTADEQFGRVSYTQYEALYARERGLKVWYFLIDGDFPKTVVTEEPSELRALQEAYRQRLMGDTHLYHVAGNLDALRAAILDLRDDLAVLRRRWQTWAAAVLVLLLFIAGAIVWSERRQRDSFSKVEAVLEHNRKMEQALSRLAEAEMQSAKSGVTLMASEQRNRAYALLESELGLPAGTLGKDLPGFALQVYQNSSSTIRQRAQAAYALNRFAESEQLGLEAAELDRKAYEVAQRQAEEHRRSSVANFVLAGWSAEKQRMYTRALEHFQAAAGLTSRTNFPTEWSHVQLGLAYVLDVLGRSKEAESILREKIAVDMKVLGAEHRETLAARNNLGIVLRLQGKAAEAEAEHRAVLLVLEPLLGGEDREVLATRSNLATSFEDQGKDADAERENRSVLEIQRRVLGPKHPDTLMTWNNLATSLLVQGKYAEAESQLRELIALQQEVLDAEHPETLRSRMNLAVVWGAQGRMAEAERENHAVRIIRERTIGAEHPETLRCRTHRASLLASQKRFSEAEVEFRAVLPILERVVGQEHPDTLRCRRDLANVKCEMGEVSEAEGEYRAVIAIQMRVLGPENPETLESRDGLAKTLWSQERMAEAEQEYREVLAIQTRLFGPEHPDCLVSRSGVASALLGQGKMEEAEGEFRQLLSSQERVVGRDHLTALKTRNDFGGLLAMMGRMSEAEQQLRATLEGQERVLGPKHLDTLITCFNLAICLGEQDKSRDALTFAIRARDGLKAELGEEHPRYLGVLEIVEELQGKEAKGREGGEKAPERAKPL